MSAPEPNERLRQIEALGNTILKVTELMDSEQWHSCELMCYRAAREARMLMLLERQEKGERKGAEG